MNPEPNNLIFLIGYRCTGKSSVGKLLSAKLGWTFIDTDSLLVSENGVSIKKIVAIHGWNTVRKMEHAIVNQVCILDRRVVATGGGVVLNDANVNLMKKNGRTVWLKALPETIKSSIETIQARLKSLEFPLRWVRMENIHLTMKFLGDIDDAESPKPESNALS